MPTNEPTTTTSWTHRAYFKQYRLNVEQYGEILVAQAFHGEKKGDAQPCYDVEATESDVRVGLHEAGASPTAIDSCLASHTGGVVRIEVKCKLARTSGGKAHVIHCRNKLKGLRHHSAATHFAVVLFDGEGNGTVEEAWFFAASIAEQLQRKNTKSGYIPVPAVRKAASMGKDGLIDIRTLIDGVASRALSVAG